MRSGFIGIVGRPNVGKSTLINSIVGKKVAITSNKPQTTRNIIQGIYNDNDSQMIFVDTPGIHKPNHKLGKVLNNQSYYSMEDSDIILMVVDGSVSLGTGDKYIIDKIKEYQKDVILVINKIDKISKEEIFQKINEYKDLYSFKEIIPLSALKKNNVSEVIKVLKQYLKDDIKYFDDDIISNRPLSFMIAEIVREKVFNQTDDEVPHSITCITENIENSKDHAKINVAIIVDRDSLKKIIIGSRGSKIKNIGIQARKELEILLGKRVYLELFVKTIKKWRDKEKYLQEFGYNDFKE
ncbi:MAG: GTPase Era [Clostridium sp.]|nr:GTPase Era [Clostridium sp.]MCM1444285.1 GTPase Era [Candidatus Amulumruptor caecigallinarius]